MNTASNALKPGHWCRPKDEKEWKAILGLAEALGIRYGPTANGHPYHRYPDVMFNVGVSQSSGDVSYMEILPRDFIRGMYEIAGQNEPCRPGVDERIDDHEKRIKALEGWSDRGEFLKDEWSKVVMPDGSVGRIVDSSVAHITVRSDKRPNERVGKHPNWRDGVKWVHPFESPRYT